MSYGDDIRTLLDISPFPTRLDFVEAFVERHSERLRFDHQRKQFLVFSGSRWVPDLDVVHGLATEMVHDALACIAADPKLDKRVGKFVRNLATGAGINGILQLAKRTPPISYRGGGWDPDPRVVGAPNGVIQLGTGELQPGTPQDMITLAVRPDYPQNDHDRSACPTWERCVYDMCDGDEDLVAYLQCAVGYSLTGLNTEQACWMLYGPGANGKSTFVETIAWVLGDYAWSAPPSTFDHGHRYGIPNDVASLMGRRFVVALSEAGASGGTRLNEARIKQFTGGDTITARKLYEEFTSGIGLTGFA